MLGAQYVETLGSKVLFAKGEWMSLVESSKH